MTIDTFQEPQLREWRTDARIIRDNHTPDKQPNNGYDRCALCAYTHHPCDTYYVADALVRLADWVLNDH